MFRVLTFAEKVNLPKAKRNKYRRALKHNWMRAIKSTVYAYLKNHELKPNSNKLNPTLRLFIEHSGISIDQSLGMHDALIKLYLSGKCPLFEEYKTKRKPRQRSKSQYQKYVDYINSKKWRDKRQEALLFYGFECGLCGCKYNLEVHHKTYKNLFNEPMADLMILCKTCHTNEHSANKKRRYKKSVN